MIKLFNGTAIDMNAEGLQSILELSDGDPSVLMDTIYDIQQYTPTLISALTEAVVLKDAGKIKLASHALKSSSAQIGALKMASLCEQLEAKSGKGELSESAHLLSQINEEFARVQQELDEWKSILSK